MPPLHSDARGMSPFAPLPVATVDYRLRLWTPTSASRAISAVAELLVISAYSSCTACFVSVFCLFLSVCLCLFFFLCYVYVYGPQLSEINK